MKYRKKPKHINPYDLNEVGGFTNECPCCGLKIMPKNVSPYDLNYAGFQNFCRCK